jgi:hypothetical protein
MVKDDNGEITEARLIPQEVSGSFQATRGAPESLRPYL